MKIRIRREGTGGRKRLTGKEWEEEMDQEGKEEEEDKDKGQEEKDEEDREKKNE